MILFDALREVSCDELSGVFVVVGGKDVEDEDAEIIYNVWKDRVDVVVVDVVKEVVVALADTTTDVGWPTNAEFKGP